MSNILQRNKKDLDVHIDEEIFGLSTPEEIDQKFKQYCNHFSGKSPQEGFFHLNIPSPKDLSPKTHNESMGDELNSHHYEKPSRGYKKSFSRSPTGWRTPDDRTEQLVKEFGVSYAVLAKLDSEDQKKEYIIDCIKKSLAEDMAELNKRDSMKNKKYDSNHPARKDIERSKADIFKWLKVKTKFEGLKKKLRSKLVELITDYENHGKIERDLEDIRKSRETSMYNTSMKLNINGVPEVKTSEILKDVLGGDQAIFKVFNKVGHHRSHSNYSTGSYAVSVQSTAPSITLKNYEDFNEEKQIESAIKESYLWNQNKEKSFVEHRDDARSRLINKINASSFNEVGFSPMVQASQMVEKKHLQRETKLAKYMNGDPLTSEDYKFLAITSKSLNACVDKKFLQAAVNYLDQEIVESIEVDLAQKILHDYQKVKDEIKEARMEFLKEETQQKISKVQQMDEKYQRKRQIERGVSDQNRVKRKLIHFIEEHERKASLTKRSEPISSAKTDIQHFANKFLKPIRDKVQKRKKTEGESVLKRLVHAASESQFDVKASKHEYHPPSKLTIPKDKHTKDLLGLSSGINDPLIPKRPNESSKILKLSLNSPMQLKNPEHFTKFYSGGPQEEERDLFGDNIFKPEEIFKNLSSAQENAICRLQSIYRGFKEREQFRQLRNTISERQRTQERIEFLKNKSESAFMRVVLQAREKIGSLNSLTNLDVRPIRSVKGNSDIKPIRSHLIPPQFSISEKDSSMMTTPLASPSRYKIVGSLKHHFDKIITPSNVSIDEINHDFKRPTSGNNASNLAQIKDIPVTRPQTASHKNNKSLTLSTTKKVERSINMSQSPPKALDSQGTKKKKFFSGLLLKQRKLINAAKSNNYEVIVMSGFTYYEHDVNIKDEKNNTPLYYAAKLGNKEFCEFLLRTGARVNDLCNEGNTALHMAFESGNHLVVMLLIQNGGNLNILNNHSQTPIAFGSNELLTILDLKSAVATFDRNHAQGLLPEAYDNSKFLKKIVKHQKDKGGLYFNFQPLHSAGEDIVEKNGTVKTFVPHGQRVTMD